MSFKQWVDQAANFLKLEWGLDKSFSILAATFYAYLVYYGLQPKITSGWRSPEKQAMLLQQFEAGDPSIVYKPAVNSKHMITKWGRPASLAIDISTSNPSVAASIANAVGLKAGYHFKNPDPVHFYQ